MFKQRFKYFKKKLPEPDFETVLDVRTDDPRFAAYSLQGRDNISGNQVRTLGLKDVFEWNVYELKSCPGLIFVVNPFTNLGQRYWIARSVTDYSKYPSVTNLDSQNDVQRVLNGKTWWEVASSGSNTKNSMEKKLRWATMGYHHNWDTKIYSEEAKGPFPNDLSQLSKVIIKAVLNLDFHPEASIVNFYLMDSFLSGHVDRSEPNHVAPLVSFSFGQTAIFLIGGHTLDENPEAVFLESGDIVLMVGSSRFRYHGVPRIIPARRQPWNELRHNDDQNEMCPVINYDCHVLDTDCVRSPYSASITWDQIRDQEFWRPFDEYLTGARINLNVRQVM